MALLINPGSVLFREPNLLTPSKKPSGSVWVDPMHYLANSLTGCWLFNDDFLDCVDGKLLEDTPACSFTYPEFISSDEGRVIDINHRYDIPSISVADIYTGGGFTIALRASPNEKAGNTGLIHCYSNSTASARLLFTDWGSDGLMDAQWGSSTNSSVTSDVTVGGYKTWSFSNTGTTGRNERLVYENGIELLDDAGRAVAEAADTRLHLGSLVGDWGACDQNWDQTNVQVSWLMFWDRALTKSEHYELARDPFQFLI